MPESKKAPNNGPNPLEASNFSPPRRVPAPNPSEALHVCPACASELVYPVDWAPADNRRWSVDLRCPDCEWSGGGVYTQEIVDRFDDELDQGTERLLGDLNLLARANMEEQVNNFIDALQADLILPEDF
jgi:predicted RNA-binding Zn-ribbon protein involved in translation (DUF1610 family)